MHVFARRIVVTFAVFALATLLPARTTTMQVADWNVGDVFVGLGDSGAFGACVDFDPVTGDCIPTTVPSPELDLYNLLGTYRVMGADGTLREDLHMPSAGVTTGCAVQPTTGNFWATAFDDYKIEELSSTHDPVNGHQLLQSIDTTQFATNPPGVASVESIVFDRAGNYYVGVPDDEDDPGPDTRDFTATLLKFSQAGQMLAEYRLPTNLYPTNYVAGAQDEHPRGVDWIDLSADGKTLFYTSEDRFIRTFTFDTDPNQGGDQSAAGPGNALTIGTTTYPVTPGVWGYANEGTGRLFALRLLPPGDGSGGALVGGSSGLYRLNAAGRQVMFISAPNTGRFFAVNLSPDAKYVWTATLDSPAVFKFHLPTGQLMSLGASDRVPMPAPVNGLCVKLEYTSQSVDCNATASSPLCRRIELCSTDSPGDDDGDGLVDYDDPDCDVPGTIEECGNIIDEDRNGLISETCGRENTENDAVSLPFGSNPFGEARTYSATNLPDGLTINPATGVISGTLSYASAGVYQVTITVKRTTAAEPKTGTGTFTWTVHDLNGPPVLTVPNQVNDERTFVSLVLPLPTDPDGDPATLEGAGPRPDDLIYDAATHTLSGWLREVSEDTTTTLYVVFYDNHGVKMQSSFTWTVRNVNRAPVITDPGPVVSDEGTSPTLQIKADELDLGDSVVSYAISAPGLPLAINAATGLISVTAPGGFPFTLGTVTKPVTVTATDEAGLGGTLTFNWTINNVNRPPVLAPIPAQVSAEGTTATVSVTATDPDVQLNDGDSLTFALVSELPLSISSAGVISGSFSYDVARPDPYPVTVTVTDSHGGTASATFNWTITNVNRAPTVGGVSDLSSPEGSSPTVTVTGGDPDGDSVTYSISSTPALPLNISSSGVISVSVPGGFPYDLGTHPYKVTVTVNDGHGLTAWTDFFWTITDVNRPPTLSVTAVPDRLINTPLTIPVTASDLDGDTLTFSQGPLWPAGFTLTTLSNTSAQVTGTSAVAGTFNFPIVVIDNRGGTATATAKAKFYTNRPPVCTAAALAGGDLWPPNHQLVAFTIGGLKDLDGDPLTVTITSISQNEPVNSTGDGDTAPDGVRDGARVWLRAERAGTKSSRIYRVVFSVSDGIASCGGTLYSAVVPHDQGKPPVPPTTTWYDSTVAPPPATKKK